MRLRLLAFVAASLLLAACQTAPPTVMVLVVTTTPEGNVTEDATAGAQAATEEATDAPATATPGPTPTLDPFPTPVTGQMYVAEQMFEHGRMFWIQPLKQIWVLEGTPEDGSGQWTIYEDTFEDGEPEFDPAIVPPSDELYQPRRGFGKLWRENEEVRDTLGWAVIPDEFGYISDYEYHFGGTVDVDGNFVAGAGYHILFSLYQEAFRFNEADGTWQLGRGGGDASADNDDGED